MAAHAGTCTDAAGDGEVNDIRSVQLQRIGDDLRVTWTVQGRVNLGSDTVGFVVYLSSVDGDHGGQASVRFTNGVQSSYSILSSADGPKKELDRKADVSEASVIALFPMDDLAEYGMPLMFSGATTLDGQDLDTCPDDDKKTGDTAYDVFTG